MNLFSERNSKILVWIGVIVFILGVVLFLWNDYSFDSTKAINSSKISQFGDYVGGLIGSLWALAGVILFYVALTEQRDDIKTNREVLITQVKALEQQIKEFELQREEMELTREVFIDQSKTLKTQQFESTFFNSLNLLNNIIENINFTKVPSPPRGIQSRSIAIEEPKTYYGRDSFEYFFKEYINIYTDLKIDYIFKKFNKVYIPSKQYNLSTENYNLFIQDSYLIFFGKYQSDLGHYFRTLYNIIKFVNDSNQENKKYYTNLVRSQFSTFEHLLLFYNCVSIFGYENFKPLVIEYSLLDNMPIDKLLDKEHCQFYDKKAYE